VPDAIHVIINNSSDDSVEVAGRITPEPDAVQHG
jgi:hypothetical protein